MLSDGRIDGCMYGMTKRTGFSLHFTRLYLFHTEDLGLVFLDGI